ncbi:hypothetical protein D357_00113 [Enterococcus faecium SD3B-2]|nr:hypothetical protein D357_00113 [Enterococcus faecium SD3B-2]
MEVLHLLNLITDQLVLIILILIQLIQLILVLLLDQKMDQLIIYLNFLISV